MRPVAFTKAVELPFVAAARGAAVDAIPSAPLLAGTSEEFFGGVAAAGWPRLLRLPFGFLGSPADAFGLRPLRGPTPRCCILVAQSKLDQPRTLEIKQKKFRLVASKFGYLQHDILS